MWHSCDQLSCGIAEETLNWTLHWPSWDDTANYTWVRDFNSWDATYSSAFREILDSFAFLVMRRTNLTAFCITGDSKSDTERLRLHKWSEPPLWEMVSSFESTTGITCDILFHTTERMAILKPPMNTAWCRADESSPEGRRGSESANAPLVSRCQAYEPPADPIRAALSFKEILQTAYIYLLG